MKRILSMILVLTMLLSLLPAAAFADDDFTVEPEEIVDTELYSEPEEEIIPEEYENPEEIPDENIEPDTPEEPEVPEESETPAEPEETEVPEESEIIETETQADVFEQALLVKVVFSCAQTEDFSGLYVYDAEGEFVEPASDDECNVFYLAPGEYSYSIMDYTMVYEALENIPFTVTADAEEQSVVIELTEAEEIEIHTEYVEYVNPLYDDYDAVSKLPVPELSEAERDELILRAKGIDTLSGETVHTSIADAAAEFREGLAARAGEITVCLRSNTAIANVSSILFDIAVEHNGIPTEGDYIRFQFGGWESEISRSSSPSGYEYTVKYTVTYYTTAAQENEMNGLIAAALNECQLGGKNRYEQIDAIYDYICRHVEYDNANLNNTEYKLKYTAYAALANRTSVCQGYAVLFYRMCLEAGIDARVISCNAMNHAWNIVSAGGRYYAADATWDADLNTRTYFLKGSDWWLKNHVYKGISEIGDQYDDADFTAAYAIPTEDYVYTPQASLPSGTCGENLTWTFENGTLTISGTGAMDDYEMLFDSNTYTSYPSAPWYDYADQIQSLIFDTGITHIGNNAFCGVRTLPEIIIPDGVKSIGDNAFSSVGESEEIAVTIPASVETIGTGITSRSFSNWCTFNVASASKNYKSVNGALFNKAGSVLYSVPRTTQGVYAVPDGVESIIYPGFILCSGITEIIMPDTVTSVDYRSFRSCTGLNKISFSANLSDIGYEAFLGCTGLETVVIPEAVTELRDGAFSYCSGLTSITIPDSVTNIGTSVFYGCTSLTDVYYNGTEEQWNEITIGDNNDPLTAAAIHFTPAVNIVASGTCGKNLRWILDDEGTLTIRGTGEMDDYSDTNPAPWDDYRESIVSAVLEDGITSIGNQAFFNCENLASVMLPDGLISIGDGAFGGCVELERVTLPDGLISIGDYLFSGFKKLTYINIPDTVESIGECAFYDCGLTGVTIPASVTDIGLAAFANTENLTAINVDEGNTVYSSVNGILYNYDKTVLLECPGGVSGIVTVPDGVKSIAEEAFMHCRKITDVSLPSGLTDIGDKAFSYCENLTDIQLNEGLTSIGTSAFSFAGITELVIPEGVRTIKQFTFGTCRSLRTIRIPYSVKTIEQGVFFFCDSLSDVYYAGTEELWNKLSIGDFNGDLERAEMHYCALGSGECGENLTWLLDENGVLTVSGTGAMDNYSDPEIEYDINPAPWYDYHESIVSVVLEDGITSIGSNAFFFCCNIKDITIPGTVKTIGEYAFNFCNELTSVTIPRSVTKIGSDAFLFTDNLQAINVEPGNTVYSSADGILYNYNKTTLIACPGGISGIVTVPNGVKNIGDAAFYNCIKITGVTLPSGLTSIGQDAFSGCALTSVTIPRTVTKLSSSAFSDIQNLTAINVEAGNTAYSSVNGILYNYNKTNLIACPGGVSGLVTIPDSVKNIGESAFQYCDKITGVSFPFSLTSIGKYAFCGCENLTDIQLPVGLRSIGFGAFYSTAITEIAIPEGITTINDFTFYYCSSLRAVTIPSSVKYIYRYAFDSCDSLTDVYFGGDISHRNKLLIEFPNESLENAEWHYREYDITYILNEGTNPDDAPARYNSITPVTLPVPTREGYSFAGWYASNSFSGSPVTELKYGSSGNKTFYAKWTGNQYTVQFNANGGTGTMANQSLTYGIETALAANAFKYAGMGFAGWNTAADGSGVSYANSEKVLNLTAEANATVTLYAMWTPLATEIRLYDPDGNDVTGETLVGDLEVTYQLSAAAVPADANQSMKWTSSSASIATVNPDTGLVKFLKPGTVTITAAANDGSAKKAIVKLTLTGFTAGTTVPSIGLQVGKTAQLNIFGSDKELVLDPTLFDYTVKTGANLLSVDENGIMTGKVPGTASVTAELRGDPLRRSVTVSVKVIPSQTDSVVLTADNYSVLYRDSIEAVITEGLYGIDAEGNIAESAETTVSYALYLNKKDTAQTRTIVINAFDSLGNPIAAKGKFTWKSGNTGLLSVKEDANGNGLITVKAKASGSATVTATSKDLAKKAGSIAVYVMDYAPKLGAASVTINTYNDEFVTVPLTESYDNTVTGIQIFEYNSKTKKYDIESTRLSVELDNGNLKISAGEVIPNGNVNTQLMVSCINGENYPISLKVVSKATAPTVKLSKSTLTLSSKFTAKTDEAAVTLNQPLGIELKEFTATAVPKGMTIDDVNVNKIFTLELDPETNVLTASQNGSAPNGTYTFAAVFTVTGANGNSSDVKATLKVTVNSTIPTVKLSKSTLTLSSIFKAKTDEAAVTLSQFGGLVLKLDDWTATSVPRGMTVDEVNDKISFVLDPETNVLTASQNGYAKNGTYTFAVTFSVTDADGNAADVKTTLKITVNSTLPTLKFSKSTLTLSSKFTARTAETTAVLSLTGLGLTIKDITPTSVPRTITAAEAKDKFDFDLDPETNVLTAGLNESVPNGTYTFTVMLTAKDAAENAADVRTTLKVTVNSTLPTVKLSKSTLTLSSVSTAKTDETVVKLSQTDLAPFINGITPTVLPKGITADEAIAKFNFVLDSETGILTAGLNETVPNGTYTFAVTLSAEDAAGNAADVKTTLRITVNAKP